jgi:hypothetical protein
MKYDIIIFQNGKEIFHDEGLNQIGGDYRNFVFDKSGSIIIRIEGIEPLSSLAEASVTVSGKVENKAQRSVDFTGVLRIKHKGLSILLVWFMTIQKKLLMKLIMFNLPKD